MRLGKFMLIHFYGDGAREGDGPDPKVELYDLPTDVGETINLADTHPREGAGAMRCLLG